jgi:hypothetical protein
MYTACLTMYVCKVLTECNLMFCASLLINIHSFPNLHQRISVYKKTRSILYSIGTDFL